MDLFAPRFTQFFGEELMAALAQRIEGCPSIRAVASIKPWVALAGFAEQLPPERCETSWTAPSRVGD
jgi:hypothetical protein